MNIEYYITKIKENKLFNLYDLSKEERAFLHKNNIKLYNCLYKRYERLKIKESSEYTSYNKTNNVQISQYELHKEIKQLMNINI